MAAVDPFSRFVLPTSHTSSLSSRKFSVSTFLPATGPTWIVDNIATFETCAVYFILVTTPVNIILRGHYTGRKSEIEHIGSRERNHCIVHGIFRYRRTVLYLCPHHTFRPSISNSCCLSVISIILRHADALV